MRRPPGFRCVRPPLGKKAPSISPKIPTHIIFLLNFLAFLYSQKHLTIPITGINGVMFVTAGIGLLAPDILLWALWPYKKMHKFNHELSQYLALRASIYARADRCLKLQSEVSVDREAILTAKASYSQSSKAEVSTILPLPSRIKDR